METNFGINNPASPIVNMTGIVPQGIYTTLSNAM